MSSCDGIDGVSTTREQTSFAYVSSCCLLSLNRRRVVPLYTRVTPVGSQSPNTGRYSYLGWSLLIPNLQYKFIYKFRFTATSLEPATGLRPSSAFLGFITFGTTDEVDPAQIGRFTPSSNIPNKTGRLNFLILLLTWIPNFYEDPTARSSPHDPA